MVMRLIILCGLFACQEKQDVETETNDLLIDADDDGYFESEDCDDSSILIHPGAEETCDGIDNNCNGEIDEDVLITFYFDGDQDGFGNAEITIEACEVPNGFVASGSDCNDSEDTVYPSAEEICDGLDNDCNDEIDEDVLQVYYLDVDGDGFGDGTQPVEECDLREGISLFDNDCNDLDATIYPTAEEECDDIDNNCNDEIDEGLLHLYYLDADEDGFGDNNSVEEACEAPLNYTAIAGDCDDIDNYTNPNAIEVCDGADNNCDGDIDEAGSIGMLTFYADDDQDGFGDPQTTQVACTAPAGFISQADDCDDTNAAKNPAMIEFCDGFDNNCDTFIDEAGAIGENTYYLDSDQDGFGDPNQTSLSCDQPTGYVDNSDDCDDEESSISPAEDESCDSIDNNCDGNIDEDSSIDALVWYIDADSDGFGSNNLSLTQCYQPNGYVDNSDDCNDLANTAYLNATEICDGIDNNCDTQIDDNDPTLDLNTATTYYLDSDGDGFGDNNNIEQTCNPSVNYISVGDDCNDADNFTNPNAIEVCDGADNNCDTFIDEAGAIGENTYYLDSDQDGFGDPNQTSLSCDQPTGYVDNSDDCDDEESSISPAEDESCDSIDNNCDGNIDEDSSIDALVWYIDADSDGFGSNNLSLTQCYQPNGYVDNSDDCNDLTNTAYPNATEICDGIDNNCDGDFDDDDPTLDLNTATIHYEDSDGDGFGVSGNIVLACTPPTDTSLVAGDCDDIDALIHPNGVETCDGNDENCDGNIDEGVLGHGSSCPATDCDEILSSDSLAGDGLYWLDPIGNGAQENYCDMSSPNGPWNYQFFSDLQVYWSFDGSSVLSADIGTATGSLYGNTNSSATSPYSGFGNSLYSDNNDSGYANISNGPTLGPVWTVMFWGMNDNCSNNQIPIIFDDESFMGDLHHKVALYYRSGGYYAFAYHDSGCSSYVNNWRHFVYVSDGASLRAWENGVEITSPTSYSYHNFNGRTINRLMNYPGFGTNGLGGYLDDLAVLDVALTSSEVQSVYQYGVNGIPLRWQ